MAPASHRLFQKAVERQTGWEADIRIRVYHHTGTAHRLLPNTPLVAVSRFNLFSETLAEYATPEWDERRVAAFKEHLLPSLLRQRIKPDRFYLMIDERVSEPVGKLIAELERYSWVRPLRVPRSLGFNKYSRVVDQAIVEEFDNRDGLICSRVDSDDALNTHYFNTLEAAIKENICDKGVDASIAFIHFPYGLIRDGNRYHVYVEHQTAFISSYSNGAGEPLTCCPYAHDRMSAAGPVFEVATEVPMWLYVRHSDNIGHCDPFRFQISGPFSEVAHLFGQR